MDFPPSLRSAGKKIADAVTNPMEAVRGLRGMLPGGTPAPVAPAAAPAPAAPAAPTAPAAAPASTPFPTIDPSMADKPAPTSAMRAGIVPPSDPRLNVAGAPEIPTLTEPHRVSPIPNTASYDAKAAGRPGPLAPAPAAPMTPAESMRNMGSNAKIGLGMAADDLRAGIKANIPGKLAGVGTLAAAGGSFLPHWGAFGDDSTLDGGQKAKLLLRDTARAAGGIVGGAAGAVLGTGTLPVVGTLAGGVGGGVAGSALVDAAGGLMRRGINAGLDAFGTGLEITSTDDDLAKDAARRAPKAGAVIAPDKAMTAATPAAPATPDDIAAFNARMGEMGATGVGMRAGLTPDSRVLYGTSAGAEKQAMTDRRMDERTDAVAAQDARANAAQTERFAQLAANERVDAIGRRQFDSGSYDADIAAAKASGSAMRISQAYSAKEAAQRSFEAGRQTDAQTASSMRGHDVTMRGQDVTERDAIRSNQTAMANGMRQAAIAQRSYNLDERKFGAEQSKTAMAERETAQKSLADTLGTMFTTKDDKGNMVPDAARVGDAVQKINDEVGARIADLQKIPQGDPSYARAQQLARDLSAKGIAALDHDDRATLMSQLAIRDRVRQTAGLMPGKAKFVDSRLGGYTQTGVDPAMIGSDRVMLGNGGYVRANDLRYNEPANAFLPDVGKQETDQFNAGLGLRRKAN